MDSEEYTDFAWEYLRRNKHYIADWELSKNSKSRPGIQSSLDRDAEKKWGLLKYADPSEKNPKNVFWSPELSSKSARVILSKYGDCIWGSLYKDAGMKVEKLTLLDKTTCIKIFNQNDYFQFFIEDIDALNCKSRIFLCFPINLDNKIKSKNVDFIKSIINNELSDINKEPPPNLLETIDDLNKGFSHRTIASKIFGKELVETEWSSDSWLRANIRYRIKKAITLVNTGYLNYI
ncbi:transcriptional regulator domain-containing protein [Trabulsiella odontotermitis]|uniref:transcriptional regulator domain-containing protein n=1 Tax=Trabulsiella odontotermitis TaxID=379893 RepID=UPI003AD4841D